ncbi:Creatinase/aminopeptidase [Marasmius fiardii PR-910]|nr:Creatinase/aminopeptidase [Marasmius fiardii PR-910]
MSPSCFSLFKPKSRPEKTPPPDETTSTVSTLVSLTENLKCEDLKENKVDTTQRLEQLRELMKEHGLDYYVIPTDDAHQSEYVAPVDERRVFISGFTGSAGQAIVSAEKAYLVTDSRYWLQAEREIDNNWELVKARAPGLPKDWSKWLLVHAKNARVGIDARYIPHSTAVVLAGRLKKLGSELVFPDENFVDAIWKDQPSRSQEPVSLHPLKFTGEHARDKLRRLREWIRQQPVDLYALDSDDSEQPVATVISSLPHIAWMLNLRGRDIPYNPVFFSYLVVGAERATLFIDPDKVSEGVHLYLSSLDVDVRPYDDIWGYLKTHEWGDEGKAIISSETSHAIARAITTPKLLVLPSQVEIMMAIKNEVEIEGFRKAHLRDGVCFSRFLAWLEAEIAKGTKITEWEAAEWLDKERSKAEYNMGLAYANISASGPSAASPHYGPTKETARVIDTKTPYLNDSGGQYLDGTCDTTRTVHFGTPTDDQCEAYTRVLQGHIAIDTAIFPEGTTGLELEVLARNKLWKRGLTYLHGTGHGFGSYMNVHEGPQGFGIHIPFRLGHVVTNEPGFYQPEQFGVRIESSLVLKRVKTKGNFGGDIWLGFERLTRVPIDTRMVKKESLTADEKRWLKDHNELCLKDLTPLLKADKRAMEWVERQARLADVLLY